MLEGTGMRTVIERLFQTTSSCGQALRQTLMKALIPAVRHVFRYLALR